MNHEQRKLYAVHRLMIVVPSGVGIFTITTSYGHETRLPAGRQRHGHVIIKGPNGRKTL
jgi:hypothetical protein